MTKMMIFVLQTRYTSNEESGGGNLVFLDRLRVSCDTGAVTSFKLEREGDRVRETEGTEKET